MIKNALYEFGFSGVNPNLFSNNRLFTDSSIIKHYISYLCAFKKFTKSDTTTR